MNFSFLKTAWSAVTGGIGSLFGGWQLTLAAAVASAGLASFLTYKVMHNASEAAVTQQAKHTVAYVVHADAINTNLGTLYAPQFVLIHDNTTRIQQEVSQHVTPQIDRAYPVPLGFVRVRNDASHGTVPPAAAGSDADPSGVQLSDVARADVTDEGTLDVCRKELSEWWDWYDQQSALWNKTGNAVSK